MDKQLQQSAPEHLQQYQEPGTPVPPHDAAFLSQHLQETLPDHMKPYADAYVQQRTEQPTVITLTASEPTGAPPDPEAIPPTPASEQSPPSQPYDFIMNPAPPPRRSPLEMLPGSSSMVARIGWIAGGALVLLILILLLRGLFGGGKNLTAFIPVIQDQQEILHLAGNAGQQQGLSDNTQNLIATLQVTVGSSQSQAITYLTNNHQKVKVKQLGLKISTSTDDQLTAAAQAQTYEQTFQQIIQSKLITYERDLQQAYAQKPGPKGRALLKDTYRQAQLFQAQLAPATKS